MLLQDNEENLSNVSLPFINYANYIDQKQLKTTRTIVKLPKLLLGQSIEENQKTIFLSKVTTNSLAPFVNYNDFVLIDTSYNKPFQQGLYLIQNKELGAYLCLIYPSEDSSKKISLKGPYGTSTSLLKNIDIVGKVVWVSKVVT